MFGKIFLFIIGMSSLASAQALSPLKLHLQSGRVGAHQGGIFESVPNTLEQFERARQAGVDIVEMDLRITKDGIPVIFHDESLQVMSHCHGLVRDHTFAELQACRFGNFSNRIPSFEDVLKWAKGKIIVDAEFKDAETIAPALTLVAQYQMTNWVYFQVQDSWDKYNLARSIDPNIALLFAARNEEDIQKVLNLDDRGLLLIEVSKETRDPITLAKLKSHGYLITEDAFDFSWNKEFLGAACDKAEAAGIDVIITNRPKGCLEQVQKINELLKPSPHSHSSSLNPERLAYNHCRD
jgi:glycerophosphoryl diester phosphodiesterase